MPHLILEYSAPLAEKYDMNAACHALKNVLLTFDLYPVGGIRVRARPCPYYAIADEHPENNFLDMIFRIGAGRTGDQKAETGRAIMAAAEAFFADALATPHFALSLEIQEISKPFSWKTNTIHPRLRKEGN